MQGFNHIAGGLVFTGIFASFHDVNVFERPEYMAVTVGAALLPDIDHTRSIVGKLVYPLARWISLKFGHRTVTHSLVFYIGTLFTIKFLELLYGVENNTYSILVAYALLSHLVFDMCTRQGIPFFYPFSSRPCVIPGNPAMRLQVHDLRSEAVIFVLFCSLILFCWPLFGAGFWQKYNETFMNYSHIQREARRKDDILEITFLDANKDTVTAELIDFKETTFVVYGAGFQPYQAKDCKFLAFEHTGVPLRSRPVQVFNVSPDSIRHYLHLPLISLQLQSNEDMYYYEGAVQHSGKTIQKTYTDHFDFYLQEPDNSDIQAEIAELNALIGQQDADYREERERITQELTQVNEQLSVGNNAFERMSDFQKGQWIRRRPNLEAERERIAEKLRQLHRPQHQADYQRLQSLKKSLARQKVTVSGNFIVLEHTMPEIALKSSL